MTLTTDVREIKRLSAQNRAVAAYLEQHGAISDYMALYEGVPGVGKVRRLAARIGELRHDYGYQIATDEDETGTVYRLIAKPGPTELTLLR